MIKIALLLKKTLSVFLLLVVSYNLNGQSTYFPIQCQGKIPKEFLTSTNEKIAAANKNYENEKKNISKSNFDRFNTTSNYYVDRLLKDGRIIFGTPMNDYVNKVGNLVLETIPELKDKVRFYIVKSASVNAFTTDQGIIFINIGLIAQLENEAELAYIISHELVHYKYKHVFESYNEKIIANSSSGIYRDATKKDRQSLLLKYSRDHEITADSLGFLEFYAKTNYSYDEVLNVFDVLLYSNLPFDEIYFDTTFFDDANYKMNREFLLGKVKHISNPEDYDDKDLTHPNVKKRRSLMIKLVTDQENPSDKKYIISKDDFLEMQKLARFEMTNLFLSNIQYDKAFYNSYLLLRKYPDNQYLLKSMAYCLYSTSIFKRFGRINEEIHNYKKIEGNLQAVSYFFKKVDKKVLSALATKWLWKYHKNYPDDEYMTKLLRNSIELSKTKYNLTFSKINKPLLANVDSLKNDSIKPNFVILSTEEYNQLGKYDKIRYDKKYAKYYGNSNTHIIEIKEENIVLSSESTDKNFERFYKSVAIKDNTSEEEEETITQKKSDNFIMVNPLFYSLEDEEIEIKKSEVNKNRLMPRLKNISEMNSINMTTLDVGELGEDDVEKFNEIALLNSWIEEYIELDDLEATHYSIPWQSSYLYNLTSKYNTNYISSTGFISTYYTGYNARLKPLITSLLFWQASPYYLTKTIIRQETVYQIFFVIDSESNELEFYNEEKLHGNTNGDFLNLMIYNSMYKYKKRTKAQNRYENL